MTNYWINGIIRIIYIRSDIIKNVLHLFIISLLFLSLYFFYNNSKFNPLDVHYKSEYLITDDLLSISVVKDSLTNSKANIVLVNHTDQDYVYGKPYSIEYKKDGIWYQLNPINEMAFISIAYTLNPLEEKLLTINWKHHYGKLPPGEYRIIKSLSLDSDRLSNQSDKIYVAANFVI